MVETPSRLVVRTYAPLRRRLAAGVLALLAAAGLYLTYELGRFDAGYDRLAVAQERTELEVEIERLEAANRELRTRLAAFETARLERERERTEVMRTIGELQAQVARQTQELAFYRGIATQGETSPGVKIQQVRIVAAAEPRRYKVRLTLIRSVRPDEVISGTVLLSVEGERDAKPATLALAALTGGKPRDLPFSFRYFESFEQEIALPEGFRPTGLTVEVRSKRRGVSPLTQSFLWKVDAA